MAEADPPRPESGETALESEGLRLLLDVSRRINSEVNLDAVLSAVVDSLVLITRADRGFLMLRDAEGSLEFSIARDKAGRPLGEKKFEISLGVVNEVAESGKTRLIDDAANQGAYQARMSVISLSLRTILCTPLQTPRGVIGVIYVDSNAITRRFTEADVPLVEAFAAQAAAAVERVRLQKAELERDRMRRQLQIASEIQKTFLPGTFPTLEGVTGAAASVPAQEVGGDFYDIIRLPEGRIGLMIGDVSGKGVPGALFGARLMSDARYEAIYRDDVASTLNAVNEVVCGRATRGMFVTFLYLVLDPTTGEVTYGNAGHLAPLVRGPDGGLDEWEQPVGIPLGIFPSATYEAATRTLEAGQTLLLITDGLGDAVGATGERFGRERVLETVRTGPPEPAALVDALCLATAEYTGRRPQADDQTLVAVALSR